VCQGLRASRRAVEGRILSVHDELLSPEAVTEMKARVRCLLLDRSKGQANGAAKRNARLTALNQEIDRLVDAIAEVGTSPALKQRLAESENEREELKSALDDRVPAAGIPSDLLARYKRAVSDLRGALSANPERVRPILHDLLGEIRLQPYGDQIYAEFETRPERIFMSGRGTSDLRCGDPQPDLEAHANQVVAKPR
jgi:site-specific DNA recombinase